MNHSVHPDTIVGKIRVLRLLLGLISSLLLILLFGWFCSRIQVPIVMSGITKVEVTFDNKENLDEYNQPIENKQVYQYPNYIIKQESHSIIVSPFIDNTQKASNEDISLLSYLLQSGLPF